MSSRSFGGGGGSGSSSGSGASSSPPGSSHAPPSNPLAIPTVSHIGARPVQSDRRTSHSSHSPPTPQSSASPISRSQALPVPIPAHAAGAGVAARFGQPRALSGSAAASALASAYELASQQQQQRQMQLQQQRRQQQNSQQPQSQSHVAAASSSNATAAAAFPDGGRNGVTLSQFNPFRGFTAASSSVPASTASNMLLSSPPAAPSGTSAFPFAASASATPPHAAAAAVAPTAAQPVPAQPVARSLPVSIPAFRRAISFVGLDQGFELFGPDGPELDGPSTSRSNHPPPKIQNVGQLGQQLRQHLRTSPSAAAGNSGYAMTDADQLNTGLELPDIASPPPGGELQLRFDPPPADHDALTNGAHNSPGARLNFDAVHVSAKDQVLGAIPHVVVHTPPQPHQQQASTIFHNPSMSSRWAPLSSSAPSHMPSFGQRRDSGSSSIASGSHAPSQKAFLSLTQQHRHRAVHTPTTIASEDNRPGSTHGTEQEWSPAPGAGTGAGAGAGDNDDDVEVDDAELDALVSHHFHGDGSSCSLSPCDSCSSESSDFSANLEDDFDVALTFPAQRENSSEDEQADVHRAVRQRLNQSKRDHHNQHHLQHRRAKVRAQIRAARIEARLRGDIQGGGDDDWKSAQLNEEDTIRVGSYTQGERQRKIQRFLEKRRRRVWSKKILYSCRKNFADRRPRVGGRFVKLTGEGEGAEGDAASAGHAAHSNSLMMMMMMGAGGGGGGSGGGSLSSSFSPGLLGPGSHGHGHGHGGDGVGLYALTQHMHGALGVPGGGPNMTAFSLPLAAYAHTSFSPAMPSAMAAGPSAAAASPAAPSTLDTLTFLKQQTPTSGSSASAAPSGLAAALGLPQANRNGQQQHAQQPHNQPAVAAPASSANHPHS